MSYDKNGNRISDSYIGNHVVQSGGETVDAGLDESGNPIYVTTPVTFGKEVGLTTETYRYDAANRMVEVKRDGVMIDTRYYDGADRVVQTGPAGTLAQGYIEQLNDGPVGNGSETRVNRYDANGRLLHQRVMKSDGEAKYDIDYQQYDAAGNVLAYSNTIHGDGGYTASYAYSQLRLDGYKEGTISGTRSDNAGEPGITTDGYDVNGTLIAVSDATKGENNRSFINDASGTILQKSQNGHIQQQLVVGGHVFAQLGSGLDPDQPTDQDGNQRYIDFHDFNLAYRPVDSNYPTAGPGTYVVAAGDTLQSIAQSAYGDSQLWYLIADANGLSGNSDLRVGETLQLPNRVGTIHNDFKSFKPYEPNKVIGDTTPNLPAPSGGDDCGGFGLILIIVVAVVVTVLTAGAAATAMGAVTTSTAGAACTTAASMSAWAAGTTALAGGFGMGTAIAAGAIGAAVGSIVSQGVGIAIGVQQEFSWTGVALAAIGGAVSGGLAGATPLAGASTSFGNVVARAAIGNAMTQGIGVMTGLQKEFSWTGVAAAAVGAGVGYGMGEALGVTKNGIRTDAFNGAGFGEQLAKASLTGFAAGLAAAAARGGRINVTQVATDAFGNALGNTWGDQLSQPESAGSQQDDKLEALNQIIDANPKALGSAFLEPGMTLGYPGETLQPGAGSTSDSLLRDEWMRNEKAGYQPGDFDPRPMSRDELVRFEKEGYQPGDFNGRDVTKSGDSLTKLFVKNYGRQPTAEELLQYGNYNNLSSPHDVSLNREIISPSLEVLKNVGYTKEQAQDYLVRDAQYQKLFQERRAQEAQLAEQRAQQASKAYLDRNDAALREYINSQVAAGMAQVHSSNQPEAAGTPTESASLGDRAARVWNDIRNVAAGGSLILAAPVVKWGAQGAKAIGMDVDPERIENNMLGAATDSLDSPAQSPVKGIATATVGAGLGVAKVVGDTIIGAGHLVILGAKENAYQLLGGENGVGDRIDSLREGHQQVEQMRSSIASGIKSFISDVPGSMGSGYDSLKQSFGNFYGNVERTFTATDNTERLLASSGAAEFATNGILAATGVYGLARGGVSATTRMLSREAAAVEVEVAAGSEAAKTVVTATDGVAGTTVPSKTLVDSEISALQRIAANNRVDTGSAARMARIDELSTANYNRILMQDLASTDYVYRSIPEKMVDVYRAQGSISGRGGSSAYFSIEGGATPLQQKLGTQMIDEPQVLLKIPTSELVNPQVPRPFGYELSPSTSGREYFVNSYPEYGPGGFRQFTATTNSFSDAWIVSPWGK